MLTGKIFDDRDNLMAPSHANKKGVRYRYYVSRALLEGRKGEVGSVTRVSAPDIEALVHDIVAEMQSRDLTAEPMQVGKVTIKKVVVKHDRVEVIINKENGADLMTVSHPYVASASARKGILNQNKKIADDPAQRLALLKAIALSLKWMVLILKGSGDIHNLAGEANLTERHFRHLSSLAYLSPKVITAIADGTAPASWTASNIARNLPLRWSEQERLLQA